MRTVALPWLLLMGFQAYQQGVKPHVLPPPSVFIWGSALMAFAAIVGQANATIGALLAWAFLLGSITGNYRQQAAQAATAQ